MFQSWCFASLSFAVLSFATVSFEPTPAYAEPSLQAASSLDRSRLLPSLEKRLARSTLTRLDRPAGNQPPEYLRQDFTRSLTQATVIYLGETHDSSPDHRLQLEILQALQAHDPRLVLAMEMFQRPYQRVLDRYLKGELSEAELVDRSEYPKRWGFPWELYAPIVRLSQANGIPIVAINTPTEVTRQVGRKGLDRLTFVDRRFIPPISEIQVGPERYRDRVAQLYAEIHQGTGNSNGLTHFFQAQVLWDETMADRISQAVREYPDRQIVVLVGQGHLLYGDGIPDRVMRRLRNNNPKFSQMTVLLNPDPSLSIQDAVTKRPIADWLVHDSP